MQCGPGYSIYKYLVSLAAKAAACRSCDRYTVGGHTGCQRHYLSWPDGLAVNWEKNGPNYNAWCGVSIDPYGHKVNDYPRTLPEDSAPPNP